MGMELYLVGGAVRDLLLGRRPTDLDFAFDGTMADFLAAHPEAVRVGKSVDVCLWHGRECMPLRGGTLAADFEARDLTINALALDTAGRLHSHPQALEDLRNSLLRPASPTAFADDPTRVFRLARFAASAVSSGTSPLVTIRRPPAAEEQAKRLAKSSLPVCFSSSRRAFSSPSFMSV